MKILLKVWILLGLSLISSLWYQHYETLHFHKAVAIFQQNPTQLTGIITGDVSRYYGTDYCTLTMDGNQKVSVKIRTDSPLLPGEKVTLDEPSLSVIQPENRSAIQVRCNMGNSTFLSATFPYEPTITRHGISNYVSYTSKLLRNCAKDYFSKHYPSNTASFLTALFSSDKSIMAEDLYQEFLDTGTVHIVVVSGMHFGLLAGAWLFLLGIFCQSRRKKLLMALPLLAIFAWFTGGTIPVLRSLVMISVLFCYDIFYVKPIKSYLTVLGLACLFVTVTPTLIFQPSFLLTFGATLGITSFYEPLLRIFQKIPVAYLRNHLALYLSVQPFTLPVVLLYFFRLPFGAMMTNFLVAPIVAPILIGTILAMAVGKIPLLGTLFLHLTNLFTRLFLWLIHLSAKISHPLIVPLGVVPFLLWIGGGFLWFLGCNVSRKRQKIVAGVLSAIFLMTAFVNTLFPIPQNQLTVTFLGNKNTNSAVIKTPSDRLILYGTLQDIAYGRGSSYEEYASVAMIILTEIPNSEQTEILLQELPKAPIICAEKYGHLMKNVSDVLLLRENLVTNTDGIRLRLFAEESALYEAEFSYREHLFSFSQNADYILRNSHNNPQKLWIVNFQQKSSATDQLSRISSPVQLLSKKEWHPDARLYDNYSMLIFRKGDFTAYGVKEQNLLWN